MGFLNLPKTGPDSWQGIRVALRCMAIMGLTAGGVRSSGVWYVGIMDEFHVTREQASWPLSIMGSLLSLIGVFAGPLAQAFSPKPVIMIGACLITIGLVSSYFVPDATWLAVTFGFIYGSGLGTVYQLNVVFLQQYFVKMRGLALGLNYAGSTTAGFIFPVLLTYLIDEVGFRHTVLIFAGILLLIFVLCCFHQEAPWLTGKDEPKSVSEDQPNGNGAPVEDASVEKEQNSVAKPKQQNRVSFRKSLDIMKIPEFYVIIFSFTTFLYAYDAYFTTIIDFVVDQNIPKIQATTIIPLYSITDMIARLSVPQLGDRGYINKRLLQCLAYTIQSVCYFCFPLVAATGQFGFIAALAMVHSAAVGTSIVMYGVLMAEVVGPARLPMAYGMVGLFVGATYFTKPYFVGYFRDTVGSYSHMYLVCGGCTTFAAVAYLVTFVTSRFIKTPKPAVSSVEDPPQVNGTQDVATDGRVQDAHQAAKAAEDRGISHNELRESRRSRGSSFLEHL